MGAQEGIQKIKMKVMVIGLDGATFNNLDPLISQGKLPNLKYLIQNGTSGYLRSTLPPLSPAAWSTFQTGKNPGKHGIFDFFKNSPGEHSYVPANSTFLKSKTLWEILSEHRKRVGVLNVMFNYPPREVNGFIVCGKETPGEDKEYTFPQPLKSEILRIEPKYESEPFKRVYQTKKFLKQVPILLNRQERINNYLFKKYSPDFFMNLFAIPDIIHHLFWKYMDPSHPHYSEKKSRKYLPLIEKCYQTLDDIIGTRMELADENTVIIIMSDHGGGPLHKIIQLNRWLKKNGFLVLKQQYQHQDSFFLSKIKELKAILRDNIIKYDIFGLFKKLKYMTIGRRMALSKKLVDWSRTKAFAGRDSEHGIYCNVKGRENSGIMSLGEEYEESRQMIISELLKLTDPLTGNRIFKGIYKREEVYKGPYVSHAPDIILDFGNNPYEPGVAISGEEIFQNVGSNGLSGMHRPDGILIAYGKDIKKGEKVNEAHISDLAPTILYLMGIAVPAEMDGKVLYDIFEASFVDKNILKYKEAQKNQSKTNGNEIEYTESEAEEIQKRLKSLGYI